MSMINNITVNILKTDKTMPTPTYAKPGDAGMDLHSAENAILAPGECKLVKTGFRVAVPKGYEMQIRARSGLAMKHSVTVTNGIGTVDSGYRGDVGVILINHGKEPFLIQKGDRIAQAVFNKFEHAHLQEVEELDATERGEGGLGHTGVK